MRRALVVLFTVVLLLLQIAVYIPVASSGNGLTIVVTFPFLYEDIDELVCKGDAVVNLVKPGMDPHEYSLTPSDIDLIKRADLIISTGHAPFETRIRELAESGQIHGKLIELPSISGVTILRHPQTNVTNYHGIQFYSRNYELLIEDVEHALEMLRPECASVYRASAEKLLQDLAALNSSVRRFSGWLAVVDLPPLQYVAVWLGLDVKQVLAREEDVPITPQDYTNAESIISSAKHVAVIATIGSAAEDKLRDMARRHGAPFIALPNPLTYNGSLEYLRTVAQIASNVSLATVTQQAGGSSASTPMLVGVVLFVIAVSIIMMYLWFKRR